MQELTSTLQEWYDAGEDSRERMPVLHHVIDKHLKTLFPDGEGRPAVDLLDANRKALIRDVNHWTGMDRELTAICIMS